MAAQCTRRGNARSHLEDRATDKPSPERDARVRGTPSAGSIPGRVRAFVACKLLTGGGRELVKPHFRELAPAGRVVAAGVAAGGVTRSEVLRLPQPLGTTATMPCIAQSDGFEPR